MSTSERQPGRPPGRRPGKQDTAAAILTAARQVFADRGFDRASIRAIATAAAVDPALVHHYYGSKHDLFLAVIRPPIDPSTVIPGVFAEGVWAGPGGVGERLARTLLSFLDAREAGAAVRGLIRSSVSDETSARLIREFFHTQIVRQVMEQVRDHVPPDQVPYRTSLVASQIFGLVGARYLIQLEPLAAAGTDAVVAAIAPTLDRYILGDLGSD